MIFYLDENLPPNLAKALNILDNKNEIYCVEKGTKDLDLIPELAEKQAVLITHDKNMRKKTEERKALEKYKLTVFFYTGVSGYWNIVKFFIKYWQDITQKAYKAKQGSFFIIKARSGVKELD